MAKKIALITAASFDAQEQEALRVLETIRQGREQAKAKQTAELSEYLKGVPVAVAKLTGAANVGIAEVISLLKKVETGTLGKVGVSVGSNHGQHAKRLTEAEESKVKESFIGRAVSLKLGNPPKTVSAICSELDISGQTYDVRRKKYEADATVQLEIANRVAAMTPAAQPAAV